MDENTQLAQRPMADRIADTLETRLPQFLAVAPPGLGEMGVKRLIRQASIAVARSEKLAACSKASVAISVLQAVELGIDLAGARPQGWIVPFKGEAKLMLSYQGLADIAYRDGAVKVIQARAVYEEDDFEIDYGNPAKPVRHTPALSADGPVGKIIGSYALAALPESPWPAFEWVDVTEIEHIRRSSRSADSDAWQNWYTEMAKKCAVRRMCKLLPTCPPRLNRALEIDREADGLTETTRRKPGAGDSVDLERLPAPGEDRPTLDPSDGQPETPPPTPAKPRPAAKPAAAKMPERFVEINESDIPF